MLPLLYIIIVGYCRPAKNVFLIRTVSKSAIERPIAYMSVFSCETGDSLTVLSQLGHLYLVFFFQTTHSGNLFSVFVALLQK